MRLHPGDVIRGAVPEQIEIAQRLLDRRILIFEERVGRRENIAAIGELDKVACPVGVDILAQSTQEIGVSIMAQYVQKRAEYNKPNTKGQ